MTALFSILNSGIETAQILCYILAYCLAILFALTFHEFAHAFAAYKSGDLTAKCLGRMSLNPFRHLDAMGTISFVIFGFGWARPVPINPMRFRSYKKNLFWVSIAGVLANLILTFVCSFFAFWFAKIANLNNFYYLMYCIFMLSTVVNFSLAIFNLLPIYPLDGFNAISAFTKYENKFVNFMRQYGQIILIVILLTGAFGYVYQYVVNGTLNGLFSLWGLIFR